MTISTKTFFQQVSDGFYSKGQNKISAVNSIFVKYAKEKTGCFVEAFFKEMFYKTDYWSKNIKTQKAKDCFEKAALFFNHAYENRRCRLNAVETLFLELYKNEAVFFPKKPTAESLVLLGAFLLALGTVYRVYISDAVGCFVSFKYGKKEEASEKIMIVLEKAAKTFFESESGSK